MNHLIEELDWRGMLHTSTPELDKLLDKQKVVGYLGTDPSADSLHIGNLASLMLLIHLQRHGHQPIALMGGATGMIGDPSGKSNERNLLDAEAIQKNLEGQKKQLKKILDFDCEKNPAIMVNNYDWFKNMNVLDFLRDVGKHLTVNYMMAKDSVKNRITTGISFTEFSYQLIQGYDFYHLFREYGCQLQMGGSDQWGNMTAGTELIRRIAGSEQEVHALTCPLITKADGTKFGKTESGAIWLDAEKTSPYKFYQFWLNTSDADAENFIKKFTLLSQEKIAQIVEEQTTAPHLRPLQKRLAQEVTTMIHGAEAWEKAVRSSDILFKGTAEDLVSLSASELLEVYEGVPTYKFDKSQYSSDLSMIDFLSTQTQILASKSEARRALDQNSIRINMQKVDLDYQISEKDLLNGTYILVQKGKKNKFLVIAE